MRVRARVACALPFLLLAATTVNAQRAPAAHIDPPSTGPAWLDAYRPAASRLVGEAVSSTFAWDRLAYLTHTIGNPLSGTPPLHRPIQWALGQVTRHRLDNT